MVANGVPNPWRSLQAILGLQMEGVEVNICCRMDNQGNVTPMVNGRVVQVQVAGVATLPTIAIVLNVSTTDQPLASLIKLQSSEDAKAVFTFRKIYIGKQSLQADGHNFRKIYHVFLSSCDNLQLFSIILTTYL